MKVCAVIAEYNPFHLGHLKQMEYIKTALGAEKVVVIMSGDFTQRGEPAILDKFTRAKHAVIAGADAVIELPAVFAVSGAEVFAKGAVKILDDLGVVDGLCFGTESGAEKEFMQTAAALNDESKEFKRALKSQLDTGVSFAKAKFLALKETHGEDINEDLLDKPNSILGVEYCRALLSYGSDIKIFPLPRENGHNDRELKKGICSATAIREAIKQGKKKKTKKSLPRYVFNDLGEYPFAFDELTVSAAILRSEKELSAVPDCTEGLENRIKALVKDNKDLNTLVEKVSTKRYTSARVRRILTCNLLGITAELTEKCLKEPLYAKILAFNKDAKEFVAEICKKSRIPVLMRKSDVSGLKKTALACYEKDVLANDLYNLATKDRVNENFTLIV